MAGLLDLADDPASQGLLSLGLRLMSTPGNFMSALGTSGLGAMGDLNSATQAKQRRDILSQEEKNRAVQMQMLQEQLRKQQEQEVRDNAFRSSMQPPQSPGMMPGAAPMNAAQAESAVGGQGYGASSASPQRAPVDPQQGMLWNALQTRQITPMQYYQALQKDDTPIALGDGGMLVTRGGKVIASNPKEARPQAMPEALRAFAAVYGEGSPEYVQAARQYAQKLTTHPAGVSVSYGAPVPFQLPDGTTGYAQPGNKPGAMPQTMTGPDGKPLIKPAEDKALTEGQAKALAFSARMLSADKTLAELNRKGVNVSVPGADAPFGVGTAVNAVQGESQQMLDQAKRDFINAALRRESGAVIGKDEFTNADKQYFPQIGDSRAVIEQKARNRRSAIEGVRADVPKNKQGEVDRISGGTPKSAVDAALEKYGNP